MSIEVRPLGVACNIKCHYCYQNPQRDASPASSRYSIEAIQDAVTKEVRPNGSFILFGGEPLLVPLPDLEKLWAWGWEKFGRNGLQTNGVLINDAHIRLFKQYNVRVGISIDGPDDLNDVRWAGSLEATRRATAKTEAALKRLCAEGIKPSVIITLHRANATAEKLPRLAEFVRQLDDMGIRAVRLHILEVDNPLVREKYTLSSEENVQAYLYFAKLEKTLKMRFDIFKDIRDLLRGEDRRATCVWMACDPYTTAAVRGVEGNGQRSNCGRTNKEGVDFVKADSPSFERYISLYYTPQDVGGCQGCRYFLMCKGQCPGTSIDGDWRNRSEHCEVWKALFEHFEKEMNVETVAGGITDAERVKMEKIFIDQWAAGRNASMSILLPLLRAPAKQNS